MKEEKSKTLWMWGLIDINLYQDYSTFLKQIFCDYSPFWIFNVMSISYLFYDLKQLKCFSYDCFTFLFTFIHIYAIFSHNRNKNRYINNVFRVYHCQFHLTFSVMEEYMKELISKCSITLCHFTFEETFSVEVLFLLI